MTMIAIANFLERICTYAARFAGILLVILMLTIVYDIVGRQFFNTGSVALQELQWHLHGAIALLGFGYAYTRDAHVRIDILHENFPHRLKLKLEFLGIVFLLTPFFLVLLWTGFDFAHRSFVRGEVSPSDLGLHHRWIVKSVVPLSALFALLGAWSVALRAILVLRGQLQLAYRKEDGLWKS
ncbi:MAG: TRAP transporter small permease subunit [Pseudomonadota bacterium]